MLVCPIVQAMVGQLGSLYLTGMGSDNGSLMLIARKTFFGTLIFCYLVLKNLAYNGTCWMASRRGTFILTWLNTSSIFFHLCVWFIIFHPIQKWSYRLVHRFSWLLFFVLFKLRSGWIWTWRCGDFSWIQFWLDGYWGMETWLSACFLDRRIWTILH